MSIDDIQKSTYEYGEEEVTEEDNSDDPKPPRSSRSKSSGRSVKRRRRKQRHGCLIVFLIFMMVIMGAVLFAFYEYNHISNFNEAADPDNDEVIEFTVKKGMVTARIAEGLEEEGLIENQKIFIYKSKLLGLDSKYKAATYKLSPSMTMEEIMETLQEGVKRYAVRFTVPEGLNLVQIGVKLQEAGVCKEEDFYSALEESYDYDFIEPAEYGDPTGTISKRANRLEGLLFPDTYEVFTDAKPEEIVDMMLAQFEKKYSEEIASSADALGLSMREVCTIASLIEREGRVDEERPVIASVIFNRLALPMKLQFCSTVQYAMGYVKPVLSIQDTEIESPYNTYIIDGLPPGPVSNFGMASLKAAVNPAETDFLYFVVKNDGSRTHNFGSSYDEFIDYKNDYLKTLD